MLTQELLVGELAADCQVAEIAEKYDVSIGRIYRLAREWGVSMKDRRVDRDNSPSPEEIAERAAEIRKGWSETEELSRIAGSMRRKRWTPQSYSREDILSANSNTFGA